MLGTSGRSSVAACRHSDSASVKAVRFLHAAHALCCVCVAGELRVPFTSGLLVGVGETAADRLRDLLLLRCLHSQHGHIAELIIQNFCPKPATRMADAAPPRAEEHLRTVCMARLVFGSDMSIQAPPNLSVSAQDKSHADLALQALLAAGVHIICSWHSASLRLHEVASCSLPDINLLLLIDCSPSQCKLH